MKKIYLLITMLSIVHIGRTQVEVTFEADMNEVEVSTDGLHLAGSFNDPDGAAGSVFPADYNGDYSNWLVTGIPMTDPDEDGVYSAVLYLNPARYEFKFFNGNSEVSSEIVPSTCTVRLDGTNNNRQIKIIIDTPVTFHACYGGCVPCGHGALRFRLDCSQMDIDLDGIPAEPVEDISSNGIHVVGDFNAFNFQANLLQDWDNDEIWECTADLGLGQLADVTFRFVNGNSESDGTEDLTGASCAVNGNRVEPVESMNAILQIHCWNACGACVPLSVEEQAWLQELSAYPVPADDLLTLNFMSEVNESVGLQLINMMGQVACTLNVVATTGRNNVQINTGILSPGIYQLTMSFGGRSLSKSLVIE